MNLNFTLCPATSWYLERLTSVLIVAIVLYSLI